MGASLAAAWGLSIPDRNGGDAASVSFTHTHTDEVELYMRTAGTTADDYNDLGPHIAEDRCCREHDHCPNVLNVGECRRGLCNTGTFTRSHCDCDARLRKCLQSLNTGS